MALRDKKRRIWQQHLHILAKHSWWSKFIPGPLCSWQGRVGTWFLKDYLNGNRFEERRMIAHGLSCSECGFVSVNNAVMEPCGPVRYGPGKTSNEGHEVWTSDAEMQSQPCDTPGRQLLETHVNQWFEEVGWRTAPGDGL